MSAVLVSLSEGGTGWHCCCCCKVFI